MALQGQELIDFRRKYGIPDTGYQVGSTSSGPITQNNGQSRADEFRAEVARRRAEKEAAAERARLQAETTSSNPIQGLANDAFKTIIAKPAIRLSQGLAAGAGALIGGDVGERLQEESNKDMAVPSPFGGKVLVEGQKAFGEGGARQIASDIAKSASYIAPVGKVGAAAGKAAGGKIAGAAAEGAIAGALGGGAAGLGESLADTTKGAGDVAKDTAIGAAVGAATGGALGAVGGALGKAAKPVREQVRRIEGDETQLMDDALEITRPVLSKQERISAIASGRAKETGIPGFKEVKITQPSTRDKEIAQSVAGIVKKGNNQIKNIAAISDEVGRIDDEIVAGLQNNNTIFNQSQLRNRLAQAKEKSRVIFANDPVLEGRYNAVIDEMLDTIGKNDLEGLFEARKAFDRTVRAKFPRTFDGNPSDNVTRNAILDVRREVNEFIADMLPKGNTFKDQLRKEHLMLEAVENIAEQAEQLVKTGRGKTILNLALTSVGLGALGYFGSQLVASPLQAAGGGGGSN